MIFGSKLDYFK